MTQTRMLRPGERVVLFRPSREEIGAAGRNCIRKLTVDLLP
jgi:hypothetical protein